MRNHFCATCLLNSVIYWKACSFHYPWWCHDTDSVRILYVKKKKQKKKKTVNVLKISTNCLFVFFFLQNAYQCSCNPRPYVVEVVSELSIYEPPLNDQNQQNDCAPTQDSDQSGHSPSLIRVFAVRSVGSYQYIAYRVASHVIICNCINWEMNKFGICDTSEGPKLSSCGQRGLWSDCADAQAELSSLGVDAILLVLSLGGSYSNDGQFGTACLS